jgi:excisionase family DNA binding protein
MPVPRLISARWLKNRGVMLRYAGNGVAPMERFVPAGGSLTTGEAAKLLGVYPLQIYRLAARGVLHFKDVKGVATVKLTELRKAQAS